MQHYKAMMKDHVLAEDEVPRDNETQFKRMRGDDYRIHECKEGNYCWAVDCGNNTSQFGLLQLRNLPLDIASCQKMLL